MSHNFLPLYQVLEISFQVNWLSKDWDLNNGKIISTSYLQLEVGFALSILFIKARKDNRTQGDLFKLLPVYTSWAMYTGNPFK